jgi:thiamine monophosphate kinase
LRAEREGRRIQQLPTPRLAVGRALARLRESGESWLGGVIDLSDGLASDAAQLARAGQARRRGAQLAAWIDPLRVPRPPGFDALCRRLGADPAALLLGGGEDYELLFAVRRSAPSAAELSRRLGVAVSEVGGLREQPAPPRRRAPPAPRPGWRHF